ncbi:AMIN domain-containing protein [Aminipila butyrica]|uniref:AMIN domain-containing protein n=1 Tax=Aminipila butyrica TaxID=433296 RepID=A0A858BYY6_9FIRM|nr:N-acetylmuramoyl-L-alanine amidase family protein [Aminipila butyrica]QIB69904.1 AMIN domain-containing protein [Aminipila butyrica]
MTKRLNFTAVFIFIILFCAMTGQTVDAATNTTDVNLVINNKQVSADVMPFIQNDRTLVPARAVFESLGGTVKWDQDSYTVTVKYDTTTVILKINDKTATVNGKKKTLDVPAIIKNERTVIPVRFVAEELGFRVGWIDSSRTVTISSAGDPEVKPEIKGNITAVSLKEGNSKKENTIVTIELSEAIKSSEGYVTTMLTTPNRFVLDVKNFLADSQVSDLTYNQKSSPLTAVRTAAYSENTARVVCDLKEASTPVVSLSADGKTLKVAFKTLSTYFNPMEDGKLVVVLDPGHGSSTAGKRSPQGILREYEFNRAVANKMKRYLEAEGVEVILTVEDDSDPSLANRCAEANNSDGDIFVSIHANAFGNGDEWTSANGWEIYHYEGSVLSNQLATAIADANFPGIGIRNRGVKTGNLYVIKNTNMPAVLIEHGFYTNLEEIELLKSDEWRDKVARYNADGIVKFLKSHSE